MPSISVRQLVELAFPASSEVVAGHQGLSNEVTWVCTLRTRVPAFDGLEGGELALLSTTGVAQLEATLFHVVQALVRGGVSSIAVAASGELEATARRVADEAAVPLVQLPAGTQLNLLEKQAIAFIVNRRAELHTRGSEIYRSLAQLAIDGKGLGAVLRAAARIADKPVALQDERLQVEVFSPGPAGAAVEGLRECLAEFVINMPTLPAGASSDPPTVRASLPIAGQGRVIAPVLVNDRVGGYLSVIGPPDELGELDRLVAGRAAAVCAIELAKQRAVLETEHRLQGEFLDDLMDAGASNPEGLRARARHLGIDLEVEQGLVVFGYDEPVGERAAAREGEAAELARRLGRELGGRLEHCLVAPRGSLVAVMTPARPAGGPEGLRRLADVTRSALRRDGPRTASAGLSAPAAGAEGLCRAGLEAEQALRVSQAMFGPDRTTAFSELGVYRLLFHLRSSPELEAFRRELLGDLLEYDGRNGGELVKTLEAFFARNGNLSRTAEELYLHRNTLIYRMGRIQEITGVQMDDPDARLSLQLALKINRTPRIGGRL